MKCEMMKCKIMEYKLYALIMTIILNIKATHNVDITICTPYVQNSLLPFDYLRSGPAADIALEKIRKQLPDVNIMYVYRHYGPDDSSCTPNEIGALAAQLYTEYNVSVFIGPGCSPAVEVLGRIAASWNLPVLTPVGTAGSLGNKKDFNTLTRLSYNMNKFAHFYMDIFRHYNWTDIAIIYDTDTGFYKIVGTSLTDEFEAAKLKVFTQSFSTNTTSNFESLLTQASKKSRVFVIATYGDTFRSIMLTARYLGMTEGDYVFILIRLFQGDGVGNISFRRGDSLDEAAKDAYESVLVVKPMRPESDLFLEFEQDVKSRALSQYNYDYGDAEVNIFITSLHDAFLIYADVLEEVLREGGDYLDGRSFSKKIWGRHFQGISGNISIDAFGDRDTDFSLLDMDPSTGKYRVVGDYFGGLKDFVLRENMSIHWPNNKGPPPNRPYCGFSGEDDRCQADEVMDQLGMVAVISTTVVVALCCISFLIYRKFKMESDLKSQWWRVSWRELNNETSGTPRQSRASSFRSLRSMLPFDQNVRTYKGTLVAIEKLDMKNVKIDRQVLMDLKLMKDVHSANLARFIGFCPDPPEIVILTEYNSRGSLQEIIHNDSIKLDRDFKLSLIEDIVQGMCFIHQSAIEVHGCLNSSNCLIDGRFVLKIAKFGLRSIRDQEPIDMKKKNLHDLLWVAPEHLRTEPFRAASQQGDVYSFAVILNEVVTRREPFEEDLGTIELNAILDKIRSHTPMNPLRPPLEKLENEDICDLIQECWTEEPTWRPPFQIIKRKLRDLKGSKSGSLLDTLLKRMEQYANNLEGLVEERTQAFLEEKRKSEELLYQVLPKSVAEKLKHGQTVIPEAFEGVTIYFSDIVGFTTLSANSTPMQVVDLLNDLYTCFDGIIGTFDVYKVETIGDAYMVVSGLPIRNGKEHTRQIARMALAIMESVKEFKIKHIENAILKVRIGIHSGPVCAGVVGRKMPRYCLFGDTVNTASRMESHGEAMRIHLSPSTQEILSSFGNFRFEERGELEVKGKGLMTTYWLLEEVKDGQNLPHLQD